MDLTLRAVALVALGGAIGAPARFMLTILITNRWQAATFPVGTFAVNVLGSLLLAVLTWMAIERIGLTPGSRLLFGTGLLGAFTTYSTFSVETMRLIENDRREVAILYVVLTTVFALLAALVGTKIGRLV